MIVLASHGLSWLELAALGSVIRAAAEVRRGVLGKKVVEHVQKWEGGGVHCAASFDFVSSLVPPRSLLDIQHTVAVKQTWERRAAVCVGAGEPPDEVVIDIEKGKNLVGLWLLKVFTKNPGCKSIVDFSCVVAAEEGGEGRKANFGVGAVEGESKKAKFGIAVVMSTEEQPFIWSAAFIQWKPNTLEYVMRTFSDVVI